jgi:DNA-binding Lrp family transcriptional regulator
VAATILGRMDERDFGLLAHLFENPFATHQDLGRRQGLSGSAAKRRLEALQRGGVLDGFWAVPAAEVFGLQPRVFVFDLPGSPVAAMDEALREETVVWTMAFQDDSIAALCYLRNPEVPEFLTETFGPPSFVKVPGYPRPTEPNPVLSPLDWRLLRAMLEDPRSTPAQLASAAHLSEKTARRRRADLIDRGFVHVHPVVNTARSTGLAVYYMAAYGMPGSPPPYVGHLAQGVPIQGVDVPPATVYFCRASSLADALAQEPWLLLVPGVSLVALAFRTASRVAADRLAKWIGSEAARWDRPARAFEPPTAVPAR